MLNQNQPEKSIFDFERLFPLSKVGQKLILNATQSATYSQLPNDHAARLLTFLRSEIYYTALLGTAHFKF